MNDVVTFCRVLGDVTRHRIVRLVANEALCICELADILEMAQSSVSSHVQQIRKAGLLESERCEKWTYFRIRSEYLKLLDSMEKTFAGAEDTSWASDAQKAARRLAERENSCCPGPEILKTRRWTRTATSPLR